MSESNKSSKKSNAESKNLVRSHKNELMYLNTTYFYILSSIYCVIFIVNEK